MTTAIAALLSGLDAQGAFATRLRAPADGLDIEVKGVGHVRFPISPSTAAELRDVARLAPFGWRDQTLLDDSVRSTWEIPGSRVKIASRRWKQLLAGYLREAERELGVPVGCRLEPVFDKLLVYERGQFFKPHQDSERSDDMVGSLVVVLPSKYTGGSLTVAHQGRKKTFHRSKYQDRDLSLLTFYADCQHEISPIKSGYRVALTYQLRLEGKSSTAADAASAKIVDELGARVRHHFETPIPKKYSREAPRAPRRLVYLLDHAYTERSLSWSRLKRADRLRAQALAAAAERLDGECFLALADVHETWGCDGGYPYDGFWRRRRYQSFTEEERDPEDYELIDLQDSTIGLRHFVGIGGESMTGVPTWVDDDELCFTKASRDIRPFKSEHEGWQGNYGNTVDRWYHRAAVVLWPRENTFALRAEMSPAWALGELAKVSPSNTAELECKVRTLLPDWRHSVGNAQSAAFFGKLMDVAGRLKSGTSAAALVEPVGADRLGNGSVRRGVVKLVETHGLKWGQQLFEDWTGAHAWQEPEWLEGLPPMCKDLAESGQPACRQLGRWLVEREMSRVRERCTRAIEQPGSWLDSTAFEKEARALALVLDAAVATGDDKVVVREFKALQRTKPSFSPAFRIAALRAFFAVPELRPRVTGSPLHRRVVDELEAVLRAPARATGDWTIDHPLPCGCKDCTELQSFLTSNRTSVDWPLGKDRRKHIHRTLDSCDLPVTHTTLRQGSPQVLRLRKEKSLFSREAAYRQKLDAIRKDLAGVTSATRRSRSRSARPIGRRARA